MLDRSQRHCCQLPRMVGEESDVWIVNEPDAIWHAMNTLPVDGVDKWLKESYISKLRQFDLIFRPNHSMAE